MGGSLTAAQSSVNPELTFVQAPLQVLPLPGRLEQQGAGRR